MEPPSGAALVQRAFETFNREGIEAVIGLFALDQQLGQVVHLREGQVHRMEVFPTVEEARAAAAPGR